MKKIVLLLIFILYYSAFSQSISVFDVDASDFPTIRAKFFAFDEDGNQITNLSPTDFKLKENDQPRDVTYISCPSKKPGAALSSVLTIDVSGSMASSGMNIAKTAANSWVDMLPLGKSECAITSFDNNNYLNQDFTTDQSKLITKIAALEPQGGTDYNYGLLQYLAGSLIISETGRHKKVVVFLTDGQPNKEPLVNQIISEANSQNCTIYSVVIGMSCPESLKDISTKTGGQWFENINNAEEAQKVYQQILMTAQGSEPCTIEWQSEISCTAGMIDVEIKLPRSQMTAKTGYLLPDRAVARLKFNLTTLKFPNPTPGEYATSQAVIVTAHNADFTVSNIIPSIAVGFDVTPKSFSLKAGESKKLTVTYFPADSGYNYCRFDIENQLCSARFYAGGGWKGKTPTIRTIKLIQPNGGEVFIAGSDTLISWEGLSPGDPVTLSYRTDDNAPWIDIVKDSVVGLSYRFKVPNIESNQYLAKVTASAKTTGNMNNEMLLIPSGTFQMGNTGAYSGDKNENPVHNVSISRFFLMSKYEITQKQYEEVMGTNPSYFKGENLPVETVSWYDAVEFCNKLSEIEGLDICYSGSGEKTVCDWDANGYRLPTEAEWEYACKAGTTTDFYSGNLGYDNVSLVDTNLDKIGWYIDNENTSTREVGQKEPNDFGLYDMSGNVCEWCWDWRAAYTESDITDPRGLFSGSIRVLRGGSFGYFAWTCRSANRDADTPKKYDKHLGFRIVRNY